MFAEDFAGRVLGFDTAAAPAYAAIAVRRQLAGKQIAPIDGMIAAVARTHGTAVATRDSDLAGCGVPVVNPGWRRELPAGSIVCRSPDCGNCGAIQAQACAGCSAVNPRA